MLVDKPGSEIRAAIESAIAGAFRNAGWRVRLRPAGNAVPADFLVRRRDETYLVELKTASEGRTDRMVPLLSQAILEARAASRQFSDRTAPLAVIGARRISAAVSDHIHDFARRYAPDVAVGVVDAEGFRSFVGAGLEGLDAKPSHRTRPLAVPPRLPALFSDLNQWMLKILIGQRLPASLISIPRGRIKNASALAEVAEVSVMSAFRLVNQLQKQGFLAEDSDHLEIVRSDELLERWESANRQAARDYPARWLIKMDERQFFAKVARYAAERNRQSKSQPRCCLGLFAAAHALSLGFVHGAGTHLYLERLDPEVFRELGLAIDDSIRRPDVYIRVPVNRESVFRAAVLENCVPATDVLQIWLDVASHPGRGREQADEIRSRVLSPPFGKS